MANEKILAKKQVTIDEIKKKVEDSSSVVLFNYRGISDSVAKEIRLKLREEGSDYKVYKNTLMARAFNDLNIDVDENLVGPSAMAYGADEVSAIKVLSKFAKKHKSIELKVGVIDGKVTDQAGLAKLAAIPSREGLLTMLATSMIAIPKNLAIGLDLYAKQLEEKEN